MSKNNNVERIVLSLSVDNLCEGTSNNSVNLLVEPSHKAVVTRGTPDQIIKYALGETVTIGNRQYTSTTKARNPHSFETLKHAVSVGEQYSVQVDEELTDRNTPVKRELEHRYFGTRKEKVPVFGDLGELLYVNERRTPIIKTERNVGKRQKEEFERVAYRTITVQPLQPMG